MPASRTVTAIGANDPSTYARTTAEPTACAVRRPVIKLLAGITAELSFTETTVGARLTHILFPRVVDVPPWEKVALTSMLVPRHRLTAPVVGVTVHAFTAVDVIIVPDRAMSRVIAGQSGLAAVSGHVQTETSGIAGSAYRWRSVDPLLAEERLSQESTLKCIWAT
ncbi:MAG: hypothetical protein IPP90_16170 [Gemmatimonadaceae bacterium]|nr:hypothetical protein [Gemmatimonadaceae bacterium]